MWPIFEQDLQVWGSEIRFIAAARSSKRISEPNYTRINTLPVFFESEIRKKSYRAIVRIPDSGPWRIGSVITALRERPDFGLIYEFLR
jgi:hypothetical protein